MGVLPTRAASPAEQAEGFVRFVHSKQVGKGTAWSIVVVDSEDKISKRIEKDDQVWFNVGFAAPLVAAGDFITFAYTIKDGKYFNIDPKTIKIDVECNLLSY